MREIKFRAWHKLFAEMFDVTALEMSDKVIDYIGGKNLTRQYQSDANTIKEIILMQFTGRQDDTGIHEVQGIDIYEGDLITLFYEEDIFSGQVQGYVEWNDDGYWQIMIASHGFSTGIFSDKISNLEVIGNIYANPELLKEPT